MTMHYTGSLLGHSARITFPDRVAEVSYSAQGIQHWCVTEKNGTIARGTERFAYMQLSAALHFLNWQEKTGLTISQLINTKKGLVEAFWSYADSKAAHGHRTSMLVYGTFELLVQQQKQ